MSKLWMRTSVAMVTLALVALMGLAGCNKSSGGSAGLLELRVVHTSTDLGPVDVYEQESGTLIFANLNYNRMTGYLQLTPGAHILEFRTAGSALASTPLFTSPALEITVSVPRTTTVLGGLLASNAATDRLRLEIYEEEFSPNSFPLARVRFVNSTADSEDLAIDTDDNGSAELTGLSRFASTPATGSNLPVADLSIGFLSGDPLSAIDTFLLAALDRDDQFFIITTGLLGARRGSNESFAILVISSQKIVSLIRPNPEIYFLHAGADVGPMAFSVNGEEITGDETYGSLTGPISITPGTSSVTSTLDTDAIFATATGTFVAGRSYLMSAVGVVGAGEAARLVQMRDEFAEDPANALLRFGNFAPDVALLDCGLLDGANYADPILWDDVPFNATVDKAGTVVAPFATVYGASDAASFAPQETFNVPSAADLRAFLFVCGGLQTGGIQAPQMFQIVVNQRPWVLTRIDAN